MLYYAYSVLIIGFLYHIRTNFELDSGKLIVQLTWLVKAPDFDMDPTDQLALLLFIVFNNCAF